MDLSEINDELAVYSVVLKFALEAHDSASRYQLKLELAQAETMASPAILITFENVARLSVSDLGGVLAWFSRNGINFEAQELERESATILSSLK